MTNDEENCSTALKGCLSILTCSFIFTPLIPGAVLLGLGLALKSYESNRMNVLTILGIVFLASTIITILVVACCTVGIKSCLKSLDENQTTGYEDSASVESLISDLLLSDN